MTKPSSSKIEQRALNVLEAIIDEHDTMDYIFNAHDKEMSWDGYINIYKKNNGDQSKKNFDSRIPVQIKGHCTDNKKYYGKRKIKYEISIDDLRVYSREKGVIYFQIFIGETQKNRKEIYYISLYPSKILYFIEKAIRRGNKGTINVPFFKLEMHPDVLYDVLKQFDIESQTQGTANTPLVQKMIKHEDFKNVTSVAIKVTRETNLKDLFNKLSSGDICMYGKIGNEEFSRPLEWMENTIYHYRQEVNKPVMSGRKTYYNSYIHETDSEGNDTLIFSKNITIVLTKGKVSFKLNSDLKNLYKDAMFLLDIEKNNSYNIGEWEFKNINFVINKDFRTTLRYIIDLYETLEMIEFETDFCFKDIPDEQHKELINIVNVRLGKYNNQFEDSYGRFIWTYGGCNVPLILQKDEEKTTLYNSVYTENLHAFIPSEKNIDIKYRLPLFLYHEAITLSNLYKFDYEKLREQIDFTNINEETSWILLEGALTLIDVYDINGDINFLNLAIYILERIELYLEKEVILINKLQIKKRYSSLDETDIIYLQNIESEDCGLMFGKYVLLEEREMAKSLYEMFSEEDQKKYQSYPIYFMYKNMFDKK